MPRLEKLRRLSAAERRVLFCALAMLPVAGLGLRVFGMRHVQSALAWQQSCSGRQTTSAAHAEAVALARLVDIAARHGPYKAKCLPRSLVLQWLLARRGIDAALRLGVRRTAAAIEAHAWLEHRGHPLIDDGAVHEAFAAFEQPIAAPGASVP